MTANEVLANVASMPSEDWLRIQAGIAEMLAARFADDDVAGIQQALQQADEEFAGGEKLNGAELRRQLGLE